MPKFYIQRDGLSMTITASSRDEAELDFAARAAQKVESTSPRPSPHAAHAERGIPVRTTKQIQAEAMTPDALAVKRNTRGIKQ